MQYLCFIKFVHLYLLLLILVIIVIIFCIVYNLTLTTFVQPTCMITNQKKAMKLMEGKKRERERCGRRIK